MGRTCCRRKGTRIAKISVFEQLEDVVQRRTHKYSSDLRTMVAYLTKGYQGVGGVLVFRDLQERYPEAYEELEGLTRKALVAAEEPEVYHLIPKGYRLDRSDPDILILNREDGTFVGAFSASGVSFQGILDAIKDHERRSLGEEG